MSVPFQEYPKKMSHPQHAAAVWKEMQGSPEYEAAKLRGIASALFKPDTVCVSPERFPEVVVTTLNQEQQYAAKGYRPNNMSDPAAYEQAILEAVPDTGYQHQEFPKWKYHAFAIPVVVQSAAEEAELGAGWADAPIIATEDDITTGASTLPESVKDAVSPAVNTAVVDPERGAEVEIQNTKPRSAAAVKSAMAGNKGKPKKAAKAKAPAHTAPA